jgi:small-conductance mechanosensitive channel
MENEQYRKIIETYFQAFRSGDFSRVKFSPRLHFLSPLSGDTVNGPEAVVAFLLGVSSRVTEVNVLSTTVDYPTASGVWQMRTTKGTLYTLNNFFRLDEHGIAYVWPMYDPKAVMADPDGLVRWLTGKGY